MTSRPSTLFTKTLACALLLAPVCAGCRWLKLGGDSQEIDQSIAEAMTEKPPAMRPPISPSTPAHAALARDGWNAALAPQPPFPSSAEFRWRHGDLETLLTLR